MNDLICPTCKTSLSGTKIAAGILWTCQTCSGAAVNSAVLRKYLRNETVNELWRTAMTQSTPSRRACPSCKRALRVFATNRDGRQISLDLCKSCQLMWFDKNELEAFPKAPESKPAEIKQALTMAEAQFQVNAEGRKLSAENIVGIAFEVIFLILRAVVFRR